MVALVVHLCKASFEEGRRLAAHSGSLATGKPLECSGVEEMHMTVLNETASCGAHRDH